MAVYDFRDKNRINLWDKVLGTGVNSLISGLVGNMMERQSEANKIKRSESLWNAINNDRQNVPGETVTSVQQFEDAPQNDYGPWNFAMGASGGRSAQPLGGLWESTKNVPGRYGRDELVGTLGRVGATPDEMKNIIGLFGPQIENDAKLGYHDAVAQRVGGLNMDVRGDPTGAAQAGLVAQAYDLKPQELWAYTSPNYKFDNVDLGDRNLSQVQDPLTGEVKNSYDTYGVNQTDKYKSDADTQQANIAAGASMYNADKNFAGKSVPTFVPVYGEDGNLYVLNNKSGVLTQTNVPVEPNGTKETKAMSAQQKIELAQKAINAFDPLKNGGVNYTPEQKWDYIVRTAGGNKDEAAAMAEGAFANGQIPAAAAEFFKTGNIRKTGKGAAQTGVKVFPASQLAQYAASNKVSEADARAYLKQKGYVVQ